MKNSVDHNIYQKSLAWLMRPSVLAFILIFILAFRIRNEALSKIPSRYLAPTPNWELSAIAISLYNGEGFANPYMIDTGPTAHLPPVYPYLIGLIYKIFDLTPKAGLISMQVMVVTGALMLALLPWISKKLGLGVQTGIIAGTGGALLSGWSGHGEFITAILMGLILVVFVRRWTEQQYSWGASILLGFAIGVAFHVQPALLTVIVGCLIFELWWSKNHKKWVHVSVLVLGIVLASIPWGWRNYATFESVFFIRSNFGLELRMGNHEGAAAAMEVMDAQDNEHRHPAAHIADAKQLREIGEIAYMQGAKDEALQWIKANPVEFSRLTVLRAANLWFGPLHKPEAMLGVSALTVLTILGAWLSFRGITIPQRAGLLIPLATYPLVYYFVAYMPRYRSPIDWVLYLLAGAAIWHLVLWLRIILGSIFPTQKETSGT